MYQVDGEGTKRRHLRALNAAVKSITSYLMVSLVHGTLLVAWNSVWGEDRGQGMEEKMLLISFPFLAA